MSVLKLKCLDQVLTVINAPVIASGGIDENTLEVDFCSEWDGFAKTAVFYKKSNKDKDKDDNKDEVYNVLMVDDRCVIPHEVTDTDCKIFIGIFGVYGSVRRTAHPINYKIVEGSFIEGKQPQEPTPDIYTQIMSVHADILEKTDRVFNVIKDVVRLTQEEYDALKVKDPDVFYVIEDTDYTQNVIINAYYDGELTMEAGYIDKLLNNPVDRLILKVQWDGSQDYDYIPIKNFILDGTKHYEFRNYHKSVIIDISEDNTEGDCSMINTSVPHAISSNVATDSNNLTLSIKGVDLEDIFHHNSNQMTPIVNDAKASEKSMYASDDTSKGTIESRLNALESSMKNLASSEFKVSGSGANYITTNSLVKLGAYVYATLEIESTTSVNINGVSVPEGFRPREKQTFTAKVKESNSSTYNQEISVGTDGLFSVGLVGVYGLSLIEVSWKV